MSQGTYEKATIASVQAAFGKAFGGKNEERWQNFTFTEKVKSYRLRLSLFS